MSVQPVTQIETLVEVLERDGIVELPGLIAPAALAAMQATFRAALAHPSWNTWRGYEQTDKHRRMVEDLLLLDPTFQELALKPRVRELMAAYLGPGYVLTEVRAWETVVTRKNFHGWHNDAWYDHALPEVPRELKLALYLTDVETGYFSYIKGTHRGTRHRHWSARQVAQYAERMVHMRAPAGSTFVFDTAGIHRQSSPVLDPRRVVMLNYHDPSVPLQEIDLLQDRYAPLRLNAAFLGGLSAEEQRVLGFGNLSTWRPGYRPPQRYRALHGLVRRLFAARLEWQERAAVARDAWGYARRRLRRGG